MIQNHGVMFALQYSRCTLRVWTKDSGPDGKTNLARHDEPFGLSV